MPTDRELCELACLAYADWGVVEKTLAPRGWGEFRCWEHGDTQAYFVRRDAVSVVAFRGTELTWRDFSTDIRICGTDGPDGFGRVHRGFHEALVEIWPEIAVFLVEHREALGDLYLTGHSMGGALADEAGAFLLSSPTIPPPAGVVTFGAPRVGGVRYAAMYDRRMTVSHRRYINRPDWVPRHPLPTWNYCHAGQRVDIGGDWWTGRLKHPLTAGSRAHRCSAYLKRMLAREAKP